MAAATDPPRTASCTSDDPSVTPAACLLRKSPLANAPHTLPVLHRGLCIPPPVPARRAADVRRRPDAPCRSGPHPRSPSAATDTSPRPLGSSAEMVATYVVGIVAPEVGVRMVSFGPAVSATTTGQALVCSCAVATAERLPAASSASTPTL